MANEGSRRRLASMVMRLVGEHTQVAADGIEGVEAAGDDLHEMIEKSAHPLSEQERAHAHDAVDGMREGRELTEPEESATEAIILPDLRPVVNITDNSFPDFDLKIWRHLNAGAAKANLLKAIPAVGRIEVPDHPSLPYAGTGFLVGDGLLMTNRHVAEIFVNGLGDRQLSFRSGLENNTVDFRREDGVPDSEPFRLREVLMVHPFWDMALLRVEGLSAGRTPLTLLSVPAEELEGQDIAVIGYPARDSRNNSTVQRRVFGDVYQVKRLQPGKVTATRSTRSFGHMVDALTHDSSTLGGNSGSALVHVSSGQVVALHFGGVYEDTNFAVPAFQLSRDARVVDRKVRFTETRVGEVEWKKFWAIPFEAGEPAGPPVIPVAPGAPGAIRLNVPLTITLKLGDNAPVTLKVPVGEAKPTPQAQFLAEARAAAQAVEKAKPVYYDATADKTARNQYYSGLREDGDLLEQLHKLLESTHRTQPRYQPAKALYPWVDRQKDGRIKSLYSAKGQSFTVEELIQLDAEVLQAREERIAQLESVTEEALEDIEATLPFNCEHTVPQSWFNQKEPMRGDLHHLFGCEMKCNSFRGNHAYFEFNDEKLMTDCGEMQPNQFEPAANKGAVARATFYFLVRYRGQLKPSNFPADRIRMLLKWHDQNRPSEWELHRNQAIFAVQGNRNPFIDLPGLSKKLDLRRGLAGMADEALPQFLEGLD